MQTSHIDFVVTEVRRGKHDLRRVTYGPYNTICGPDFVWQAKRLLKLLPIICPTCKQAIKVKS